jgi:hypothetical protein
MAERKNGISGPHQGQPVRTAGEPVGRARAAMLMVHGRGARAGFRRVGDLLVERVLALRLVRVHGHPQVPENLVAEARRVFLGNRDQAWLEALSMAGRSQAAADRMKRD